MAPCSAYGWGGSARAKMRGRRGGVVVTVGLGEGQGLGVGSSGEETVKDLVNFGALFLGDFLGLGGPGELFLGGTDSVTGADKVVAENGRHGPLDLALGIGNAFLGIGNGLLGNQNGSLGDVEVLRASAKTASAMKRPFCSLIRVSSARRSSSSATAALKSSSQLA